MDCSRKSKGHHQVCLFLATLAFSSATFKKSTFSGCGSDLLTVKKSLCCLMTATIDLRWVISYSLCRNHVQALDKVAKHTWVGPRVRLGVTLERTKPSAQTGVVDCGSCTWVEVILLWLLLEKLFCFCYNCKLWGFNSYCANSSVKSC